eukprot:scaffold33587_cov107-Skeletonema_dohrnii-CCMP3373.AAC.2
MRRPDATEKINIMKLYSSQTIQTCQSMVGVEATVGERSVILDTLVKLDTSSKMTKIVSLRCHNTKTKH